MKKKLMTSITMAMVVFAMIIIVSLLLSLPVMLAWNFSVATIFDLPEITWMQAWCLGLLTNLLCKSTVKNNGTTS